MCTVVKNWMVVWDQLDSDGVPLRRKLHASFESERHALSWAEDNLTKRDRLIAALPTKVLVDEPPVAKGVKVVKGDGWDALYVDGVLQQEGHGIGLWEIAGLEAFSGVLAVEYVDDAWLAEVESYPSSLAEVRFYKPE